MADHIFRIEDGEIAEERCSYDQLSLLEQLGLVSAPKEIVSIRPLAVLG
jgi:hypothetical protein